MDQLSHDAAASRRTAAGLPLARAFGQYLAEQREALNLTRDQLAVLVGLEPSTEAVAHIESGIDSIPQQRWPLFADALRIDPRDFGRRATAAYMPEVFRAVEGRRPVAGDIAA